MRAHISAQRGLCSMGERTTNHSPSFLSARFAVSSGSAASVAEALHKIAAATTRILIIRLRLPASILMERPTTTHCAEYRLEAGPRVLRHAPRAGDPQFRRLGRCRLARQGRAALLGGNRRAR